METTREDSSLFYKHKRRHQCSKRAFSASETYYSFFTHCVWVSLTVATVARSKNVCGWLGLYLYVMFTLYVGPPPNGATHPRFGRWRDRVPTNEITSSENRTHPIYRLNCQGVPITSISERKGAIQITIMYKVANNTGQSHRPSDPTPSL